MAGPPGAAAAAAVAVAAPPASTAETVRQVATKTDEIATGASHRPHFKGVRAGCMTRGSGEGKRGVMHRGEQQVIQSGKEAGERAGGDEDRRREGEPTARRRRLADAAGVAPPSAPGERLCIVGSRVSERAWPRGSVKKWMKEHSGSCEVGRERTAGLHLPELSVPPPFPQLQRKVGTAAANLPWPPRTRRRRG